MPILRKRLLVDEWVIIAPERADRPQQFETSTISQRSICPFCPQGAELTPPTISSWQSPAYPEEQWAVRAIPNKFPALRVEESPDTGDDPLYQTRSGLGAHEVIIEAPSHHKNWEELSPQHLRVVLESWRDRMTDLSGDERLRCAVVFKNQGPLAGATLEHVHSQLVALPRVPSKLQRELDGANQYHLDHDRCAICDMIARERQSGERIVIENEGAIAIAPYGSRMPFELWILPMDHHGDFMASGESLLQKVAQLVADVLPLCTKAIGSRAHNLILHTLPFDLVGEPYYHWHLQLLPRTGRIAGFEWGSDIFINATPSEVAAHHLRNLVP